MVVNLPHDTWAVDVVDGRPDVLVRDNCSGRVRIRSFWYKRKPKTYQVIVMS